MGHRVFTSFAVFAVTLAIARSASAQCTPANWGGASGPDAEGGTAYASFQSTIANADVGYRVSLPAGYASAPNDRYNVLYLLHGGGGNLLTMSYFVKELRAAAAKGVAPANVITISVNGLESLYVNSDPQAPFSIPMEDVIMKELVPHVDATYRTLGTRATRGVAGFSMGGYGALHLGLRYFDRFGVVFEMAGAIVVPLPGEGFTCMFGDDQTYFDAEHPTALLEANVAAIKQSPLFLQLTVGGADTGRGTYASNVAFHDKLAALGVVHRWDVVPGIKHSYHGLIDTQNAAGANPFQILVDAWTPGAPPPPPPGGGSPSPGSGEPPPPIVPAGAVPADSATESGCRAAPVSARSPSLAIAAAISAVATALRRVRRRRAAPR